MLAKAFSSLRRFLARLSNLALAVPVRVKIVGIMTIPVVVLGLVLTYWIRTGLSDWLSYLLSDVRVQAAMQAGTRSVIFVTFLAAAFSITLTYLLMYILTRPLLDLRSTALQVAVARGGHLATPALGVHERSVVGEPEPRPVRAVVAPVGPRGWRTGPDDDSSRVAVRPVERVRPARREPRGPGVVQAIVEVLRT